MGKTCCIKACKSESYNGCGVSFHWFPKNPELRNKWIEAIGTRGTFGKSPAICSRHFKIDDYFPTNVFKLKSLKPGVVPSLFSEVTEWDERRLQYLIESDVKSCDETTDDVNKDKSKNKIMIVAPISKINRIEDAITTKTNSIDDECDPLAENKGTSSLRQIRVEHYVPIAKKHTGTTIHDVKVYSHKSLTPETGHGLLNSAVPRQERGSNIMVVKPICEKNKIEDTISTNTQSSNDSDDSLDDDSFDDDLDSDDSSSDITLDDALDNKVKINNPLKRKYVELLLKNHNNRVINSSQATTKKEVSSVYTQTGHYNSPKEEEYRKRIKALSQRLKRRTVTCNQLKAMLQFVKQCKNFEEVQQILTIKLTQIPENFNCDDEIVIINT